MTCPADTELAAQLDGELTQNRSDAVAEHLAGCARCRKAQARLRAAASGLSDALPAPEDERWTREVVGKLAAPASPQRTWLYPAFGALAAACLALVVFQPLSEPEGLVARGASAPSSTKQERMLGFTARLHPRSLSGESRPLREGDTLTPGDGLSFLLLNRTGEPTHCLLFALDAHGESHWFHPSWQSESEDPVSPRVEANPQQLALPEGTTPDLAVTGPFLVVALFNPSPLKVVDVEAALHRGGLEALRRQVPSAQLHTLLMKVAPGETR